jgi:hypothetical protein
VPALRRWQPRAAPGRVRQRSWQVPTTGRERSRSWGPGQAGGVYISCRGCPSSCPLVSALQPLGAVRFAGISHQKGTRKPNPTDRRIGKEERRATARTWHPPAGLERLPIPSLRVLSCAARTAAYVRVCARAARAGPDRTAGGFEEGSWEASGSGRIARGRCRRPTWV